MLFFHGHHLCGVIIPKNPPCFAIPFFHPDPSCSDDLCSRPSRVFIQDVAQQSMSSFASILLEDDTQTIHARAIRSLLLETGNFDFFRSPLEEIDEPHNDAFYISGHFRLYCYAASYDQVIAGTRAPLATWFAKKNRTANSNFDNGNSQSLDWESSEDSDERRNSFRLLEIAKFCNDRDACLVACQRCFESLAKHNRSLAVHWLQMTKDFLKRDGILESND